MHAKGAEKVYWSDYIIVQSGKVFTFCTIYCLVERHTIHWAEWSLIYSHQMSWIMRKVSIRSIEWNFRKLIDQFIVVFSSTSFRYSNISDSDELTPMREFYKGKTICNTGGSGFMGKVSAIHSIVFCFHFAKCKRVTWSSDIWFIVGNERNPNFSSTNERKSAGISPRLTCVRKIFIVNHAINWFHCKWLSQLPRKKMFRAFVDWDREMVQSFQLTIITS